MIKQYMISFNTPIGLQKGLLQFNIDNTNLKGRIICKKGTSLFTKGTLVNSTFQFEGLLNISVFSINYYVKGLLNGNKIKGTIYTKYGTFYFKGIEKN